MKDERLLVGGWWVQRTAEMALLFLLSITYIFMPLVVLVEIRAVIVQIKYTYYASSTEFGIVFISFRLLQYTKRKF